MLINCGAWGCSDLGCFSQKQPWSQVPLLPIEFNDAFEKHTPDQWCISQKQLRSQLVLANDGFEKRTPDLCHKTPYVEFECIPLIALHPQNAINFNPLMRHALAGADPEKDEFRK